jgi:pentatricopeptide repeat protein
VRLALSLVAKCIAEADALLPADAGLKGNVVLYTTLMTVCHKGGKPERAMRIFRTMEGEGLQADVVRTLLDSHPMPCEYHIMYQRAFPSPLVLASHAQWLSKRWAAVPELSKWQKNCACCGSKVAHRCR